MIDEQIFLSHNSTESVSILVWNVRLTASKKFEKMGCTNKNAPGQSLQNGWIQIPVTYVQSSTILVVLVVGFLSSICTTLVRHTIFVLPCNTVCTEKIAFSQQPLQWPWSLKAPLELFCCPIQHHSLQPFSCLSVVSLQEILEEKMVCLQSIFCRNQLFLPTK